MSVLCFRQGKKVEMYYIALFTVLATACAVPVLIEFYPSNKVPVAENLSLPLNTSEILLSSKVEEVIESKESLEQQTNMKGVEENVEQEGLRKKRSASDVHTVKDVIQKIANCILFRNHHHLGSHCYHSKLESRVNILYWNELVMSPNNSCAVQVSAPHGIAEVRCHPRVVDKRCNAKSSAHWRQLYAVVNDNDGTIPETYSTSPIPIACVCATVSARRIVGLYRPKLSK